MSNSNKSKDLIVSEMETYRDSIHSFYDGLTQEDCINAAKESSEKILTHVESIKSAMFQAFKMGADYGHSYNSQLGTIEENFEGLWEGGNFFSEVGEE